MGLFGKKSSSSNSWGNNSTEIVSSRNGKDVFLASASNGGKDKGVGKIEKTYTSNGETMHVVKWPNGSETVQRSDEIKDFF